MNFLIHKHVIPTLPAAKVKNTIAEQGAAGFFAKYNNSKLCLQNEYFFKLDFALKFLKLIKQTCKQLVLRDVQSEDNFKYLIEALQNQSS